MLYVSTKSKTDFYTAHRALHNRFAGDGGMFVPFHLVTIEPEQLAAWKGKSAGEAIALILNGFFGLSLTGWDVEYAIGRTPFRAVAMNRRITVAECWRSISGSWDKIVRNLHICMGCRDTVAADIQGWVRIAIEIAILFGIYAQIDDDGTGTFDICVAGGNFATVAAALYAKDMGLPVGKILCVCNENSGFWDLIHRGEFNTGLAVIKTALSELDITRPRYLEYLIHRAFGIEGVKQYLDACDKNGVFYLDEDMEVRLTDELLTAVSSSSRVDAVISSLYRTNGYIADPVTALIYGGLQDYRASSGVSNHTLLLAKDSPLDSSSTVAQALGITRNELIKQINSPRSK
ncbi:MAG: hypothetical protein IJB47_06980 [Oscillospiraceae bacterium]|nr:hypothetical protein [Oscillospiraceae bacterium]